MILLVLCFVGFALYLYLSYLVIFKLVPLIEEKWIPIIKAKYELNDIDATIEELLFEELDEEIEDINDEYAFNWGERMKVIKHNDGRVIFETRGEEPAIILVALHGLAVMSAGKDDEVTDFVTAMMLDMDDRYVLKV